MQSDARPRQQLVRQPGVELGRDDGEIERKRARGEAVDQRQQAGVGPAGVVVAEEDPHRGAPRRAPPRPDAAKRFAHRARSRFVTCVAGVSTGDVLPAGPSATSSWASRGSPRRSSPASPAGRAGRACRCGCSWSSRSRSASASVPPVVDAIRRPAGAPARLASLTTPLHRWRRADLRRSPRRCAASSRRPCGFARATATTLAQAVRDRRTRFGPAQDLHQGAAAGDRARRPSARRAGRPPPARALRPRHDHDHVARRAHRRPAVLLHRPRARHLRRAPQPEGLAAPQAAAARFVVTCTSANVAT